MTRPMPDAAAELIIERMLCAVKCIPVERVISHGGLAGLVGTSARQTGVIMVPVGSGVPW